MDYPHAAQTGVLIFSLTVSSVCVDVSIEDDNIVENPETFTVTLNTSEPRVTLDPDEVMVAIFDNDG